MKYSGAEIIVKLLEIQGVEIVAGIPGGANLPLYDALHKSTIKHVLARHEQGAGFIAHGMARSTGIPAVCFATSGPGITNLLTAIADAKLDSVPLISIIGQVPTTMIGTDAFQEVDTYGLTLSITKHNVLVRSAKELLHVIPAAFRIAEDGRPGPVAVDVPKNVQTQVIEIADDEWPCKVIGFEKIAPTQYEVQRAAEIINRSERPLLYVGGGVVHSNAYGELGTLAHKSNIPVTATLMGLGCFNAADDLFLGMLGMHGARYTNFIVNEADVIIAMGVRFDDRATGNVEKFCPNAKILHIDIDESEINKIKKAHFHISADAKTFLTELLPLIQHNTRTKWITEVETIKSRYPFPSPDENDKLHPYNFIKNISRMAPADAIITTDVGQHQMWAAQGYPFTKTRTLLTSGGLGTMGFGLPAAIGAALANPGKRVVCFSGDGSILMNIQELATLADLGVNVTVLIMNNKHLGLVRQQQELFYEKNFIASKFHTNPDYVMISKGFGVRAYDLEAKDDWDVILKEALSTPGPCVVNVPVRYSENVMPMVPPGAGNHEAIE